MKKKRGKPFEKGSPQGEATRFQPGNLANPGGRPKGLARYVRERAGGNGELLVNLLFAAIGGTLPEGQNPDGTVKLVPVSVPDRLQAVKILLERGWGKAPAFAPMEDEDPLDLGAGDEAVEDFLSGLDELAAKRAARQAEKKRPADAAAPAKPEVRPEVVPSRRRERERPRPRPAPEQPVAAAASSTSSAVNDRLSRRAR